MKKLIIKNKILSLILCGTLLLTMQNFIIPIIPTSSAATPANVEISSLDDMWAGIMPYQKLPTMEEYNELGYQKPNLISFSEFVETVGSGGSFNLAAANAIKENGTKIRIDTPLDLYNLSTRCISDLTKTITDEMCFYLSADYLLGNNLDYKTFLTTAGNTNKYFIPIGGTDDQHPSDLTIAPPFTGTFDGQGFEVIGLTFNELDLSTISRYSYGMFGNIGADGIVQNLGVLYPRVNTIAHAGGATGFIAGENDGTIRNAYVISNVNPTGMVDNDTLGYLKTNLAYSTGAICGTNNGTIENVYVCDTGSNCTGVQNGGPICGINNGGTVQNAYYLNVYTGTNTSNIGTSATFAQLTGMTSPVSFTDGDWHITSLNSSTKTFPKLCGLKGAGTSANPYTLETPADLIQFPNTYEYGIGGSSASRYFRLKNSIDMNYAAPNAYVPSGAAFTGFFSGAVVLGGPADSALHPNTNGWRDDSSILDSYAIINLTINTPATVTVSSSPYYVMGLFGYISGTNTSISNINFIGGNITPSSSFDFTQSASTSRYMGGIATVYGLASNSAMAISDVHSSVNVSGGSGAISGNGVGGICGVSTTTSINISLNRVSNSGTVSGGTHSTNTNISSFNSVGGVSAMSVLSANYIANYGTVYGTGVYGTLLSNIANNLGTAINFGVAGAISGTGVNRGNDNYRYLANFGDVYDIPMNDSSPLSIISGQYYLNATTTVAGVTNAPATRTTKTDNTSAGYFYNEGNVTAFTRLAYIGGIVSARSSYSYTIADAWNKGDITTYSNANSIFGIAYSSANTYMCKNDGQILFAPDTPFAGIPQTATYTSVVNHFISGVNYASITSTILGADTCVNNGQIKIDMSNIHGTLSTTGASYFANLRISGVVTAAAANCQNNGEIDVKSGSAVLTAISSDYAGFGLYISGVACYGSADTCENTADISVTDSAAYADMENSIPMFTLGRMVGVCGSDGTDCKNTGNIRLEDAASYHTMATNDSYDSDFRLGGIANAYSTNCVNYGSISATNVGTTPALGGIVTEQLASTTISNCVNYGDLTLLECGLLYPNLNNSSRIGGIVAFSRGTVSSTNTVDSCENNGKMTAINCRGVTVSGISCLRMVSSTGSDIINCSNNGGFELIDILGSITVSGMVTRGNANNCINNGNILIDNTNSIESIENAAATIYGIFRGYDAGNIISNSSNNTNNGDITIRNRYMPTGTANPTISVYGIGLNSAYTANTISGCVNTGTLTASGLQRPTSNNGAILNYYGIGACPTVSNCTSSGDISLNNCFTSNICGIIGSGFASSCINYANVDVDNTANTYNSNTTVYGIGSGSASSCLNMGNINIDGVVGTTTVSGIINGEAASVVSNCINNGNVTVTNSGIVNLSGIISSAQNTVFNSVNLGNISVSKNISAATVYIGGIARIFGASAAIDSCANYGTIDISAGTAYAYSTTYIGGILGSSTIASSATDPTDKTFVIANCLNKGDISLTDSMSGNITRRIGGIVGYISTGRDAVDGALTTSETNSWTLNNNVNYGGINLTFGSVNPSNTSLGGIVGYYAGYNLLNATFKNMVNAADIIYSSASTYAPGGIGMLFGAKNTHSTNQTNSSLTIDGMVNLNSTLSYLTKSTMSGPDGYTTIRNIYSKSPSFLNTGSITPVTSLQDSVLYDPSFFLNSDTSFTYMPYEELSAWLQGVYTENDQDPAANDIYGAYCLSPSSDSTNSTYLPANIGLNAINPMINGVSVSDWQSIINPLLTELNAQIIPQTGTAIKNASVTDAVTQKMFSKYCDVDEANSTVTLYVGCYLFSPGNAMNINSIITTTGATAYWVDENGDNQPYSLCTINAPNKGDLSGSQVKILVVGADGIEQQLWTLKVIAVDASGIDGNGMFGVPVNYNLATATQNLDNGTSTIDTSTSPYKEQTTMTLAVPSKSSNIYEYPDTLYFHFLGYSRSNIVFTFSGLTNIASTSMIGYNLYDMTDPNNPVLVSPSNYTLAASTSGTTNQNRDFVAATSTITFTNSYGLASAVDYRMDFLMPDGNILRLKLQRQQNWRAFFTTGTSFYATYGDYAVPAVPYTAYSNYTNFFTTNLYNAAGAYVGTPSTSKNATYTSKLNRIYVKANDDGSYLPFKYASDPTPVTSEDGTNTNYYELSKIVSQTDVTSSLSSVSVSGHTLSSMDNIVLPHDAESNYVFTIAFTSSTNVQAYATNSNYRYGVLYRPTNSDSYIALDETTSPKLSEVLVGNSTGLSFTINKSAPSGEYQVIPKKTMTETFAVPYDIYDMESLELLQSVSANTPITWAAYMCPVSFSIPKSDDSYLKALVIEGSSNVPVVTNADPGTGCTDYYSFVNSTPDLIANYSFGITDAERPKKFNIKTMLAFGAQSSNVTFTLPKNAALWASDDGVTYIPLSSDTDTIGGVVTDPQTITKYYKIVSQSGNYETVYCIELSSAPPNKEIGIVKLNTSTSAQAIATEVLSYQGNIPISIKQISTPSAFQTYSFTNAADSTDKMQNISAGRFAVFVDVPYGYTYSVNVEGGATLPDYGDGINAKLLLLPSLSQEHVELTVTITKIEDYNQPWGQRILQCLGFKNY